MKTDAERLQFVIRFAQMDLDTLRPGDWLNLRDDLGSFLTGSLYGQEYYAGDTPMGRDVEVRPMDPPFPYEYPEDAFRELQEETRHILRTMVVAPRAGHSVWAPIPLQVQLATPSLDGLIPATGQHLLIAEGATRDMFLLLVFVLLARGSTVRILRCPECSTIFYRVGKQLYCSRTCSNRANVRTWRQREEVKQAEAERAHTRYANTKKREIGQGTKIERRPRKRSTGHAETPRES